MIFQSRIVQSCEVRNTLHEIHQIGNISVNSNFSDTYKYLFLNFWHYSKVSPQQTNRTSSISRITMLHRYVSHRPLLLSSLLLLFLNRSCTFSFPTTTLREYLVQNEENDDAGIYLGMAPAFFGFFGYFGALAGIEDELSRSTSDDEFAPETSVLIERKILKGVAGASSGAMAAVLLASGISPHKGGKYASKIKLSDFADPGGVGGFFKGNRFEILMNEFLQGLSPVATMKNTNSTLQLEDALIPVAVSAVNIQPQITPEEPSWLQALASPLDFLSSTYFPTEKVLSQGPMARAARASACFPMLFQPVGWIDTYSDSTNSDKYSLLIDGGIFDMAGYNGLREIVQKTGSGENKINVLNLSIGSFLPAPHGPEDVSQDLNVAVDSVFSLSIINLPFCSPLTMENGPIAIRAARRAIRAAMDQPISAITSTSTINGKEIEQYHFVLEIDASPFLDTTVDEKNVQ